MCDDRLIDDGATGSGDWSSAVSLSLSVSPSPLSLSFSLAHSLPPPLLFVSLARTSICVRRSKSISLFLRGNITTRSVTRSTITDAFADTPLQRARCASTVSESRSAERYANAYVRACVRVRVCVLVCVHVTTRADARAHASHKRVYANGSAWSESQDRFTPFTKSASPLSRKNEKGDNLLGVTPIKEFEE